MTLHARRSLTAAILAAALVGGASAHAQIGGFLKKKLPKLPVTGASAPAPAAPERPKYCAAITDEVLDRFLSALNAENAALAKRQAARQRVADAGRYAAEVMTPEGFAKFEACKEAAIAKDPRTKERDRLRALADDAVRKVDNRKYQEYSAQADAIDELIDASAEKACGGGPKAAAASLEAADTQAAVTALMADAEDPARAGSKAGGFTEQEYARLKECVIGRLSTPNTTPTTPESAEAIDKRADELEKALPLK